MSAYVDHTFHKGFILDEARVRKVHDLITSRLAKLDGPPELKIRVFRGDSYVYETSSVDEVLKEDNDDWRAIARLEFFAEVGDVFTFLLRFSSRETSIFMVGDDRDAVFLIFSDVREYLLASVLTGIPVSKDVIRVIGILGMLIGMAGFFWSLIGSIKPDHVGIVNAIADKDILRKINYLIGRGDIKQISLFPFGWVVLMVLSTVGTVSGMFEIAWQLIFPANLFLFGQRKVIYDRRRALLGKVFWGIFVSLAVSVVAGIIIARQ